MFTNRCHVMFDLFFFCHVKLMLSSIRLVSKETRNEFTVSLIQLFLFGMGQCYMDTSAPPIFALELAEAIIHIQVK